jgi:hypothetical protein
MRRVLLIVGLLAAAFGVGCLNFTSFGGAEHHRAWAQKHGMPEPSAAIFMLGVASAVLGSALFGFTLRRPREAK